MSHFARGNLSDGAVIERQNPNDPGADPNDGVVTLGSAAGAIGPWATTNSLPHPEQGHGIAIHEDRIYMTDALEEGNNLLMGTAGYDGSIGWQAIAFMPGYTRREEAVTWNNRLYAIHSYRETSGQVFASYLNIGGTISEWIALEPLPDPVWGHSAVVYNGSIFVIGGFSGLTGCATNTVYRSSVRADGTITPWEALAGKELPAPRGFGAAVMLTNHLVYLGGYYVWMGHPICGEQAPEVYSSEIYSVGIDDAGNFGDWQMAGDLPYGAYGLQATSVNGTIVVSGGYDGTTAHADVLAVSINPMTGMVNGLAALNSLPAPRTQHMMAAVQNKLIVMGGVACMNQACENETTVWRAEFVEGDGITQRGSYRNTFNLGSEKPLEYLAWTANTPGTSSAEVICFVAGSDGVFDTAFWESDPSPTQLRLDTQGQYVQYEITLTDIPPVLRSTGRQQETDVVERPQIYDVTLHFRDPDPGSTPVGYDVTTALSQGTLTYDQVVNAGQTQATEVPNPPSQPPGYRPIKYVGLSTTATFLGGIRLAIGFDRTSILDPSRVKLFHWDQAGETWDEITDFVDGAVGIINGIANSLSPFLIAEYDGVTGINDHPGAHTPNLSLASYPNPFNPSTTVEYSLPKASQVDLRVYQVSGRLVRTLAHGPRPAGNHTVRWDGKDDRGYAVSSGVYFLRLTTAGQVRTGKLVLLK